MSSITNERVRIRLRVHLVPEVIRQAASQNGKYFLAVTGPGLQLGFGDHDKAPRMTTTGHDIWNKELWILKNTQLTYNYLVVQRYTNEVLHCEMIAAREIGVGVTPLTINDTYNRVQFRFNNDRNKQRSRANASGINTRSQNKTNYRPEYHKGRGNCLTTIEKHDKMSELAGDGREEVVNLTEKIKTCTSNAAADGNNNVVKACCELSTEKPTKWFSSLEDGVKREAPTSCQFNGEDESISVSCFDWKYTTYMQFAGKIGLAAVVAYGVYKLVLKR